MKRALKMMRRIIENHYSGERGWILSGGCLRGIGVWAFAPCPAVCTRGPAFLLEAPEWWRWVIMGQAHRVEWSLSAWRFTPFNPHRKPTEWVLFSSPSHRGGSWGLVCSQEGRVCSGFIACTRNIDVLHLYCWVSFCLDKWNPRKWVQTLLLDFLFSLRGQDWAGSYDLPPAQANCPAHGGLRAWGGPSWSWASERHGAIDDPVKPLASCCWFLSCRGVDMLGPILWLWVFLFALSWEEWK